MRKHTHTHAHTLTRATRTSASASTVKHKVASRRWQNFTGFFFALPLRKGWRQGVVASSIAEVLSSNLGTLNFSHLRRFPFDKVKPVRFGSYRLPATFGLLWLWFPKLQSMTQVKNEANWRMGKSRAWGQLIKLNIFPVLGDLRTSKEPRIMTIVSTLVDLHGRILKKIKQP